MFMLRRHCQFQGLHVNINSNKKHVTSAFEIPPLYYAGPRATLLHFVHARMHTQAHTSVSLQDPKTTEPSCGTLFRAWHTHVSPVKTRRDDLGNRPGEQLPASQLSPLMSQHSEVVAAVLVIRFPRARTASDPAYRKPIENQSDVDRT
jgi:hypothetical protein